MSLHHRPADPKHSRRHLAARLSVTHRRSLHTSLPSVMLETSAVPLPMKAPNPDSRGCGQDRLSAGQLLADPGVVHTWQAPQGKSHIFCGPQFLCVPHSRAGQCFNSKMMLLMILSLKMQSHITKRWEHLSNLSRRTCHFASINVLTQT